MRKITRICMLALLIAVLLVPYDMAFASSGTIIKNAGKPVSAYTKKRAASTEEPFLKKKDASILTGTSSTLQFITYLITVMFHIKVQMKLFSL